MSARTRATVEFRPGQVEPGAGAVLLDAMRAEIAELYDGLDLDAAFMPRGGAAELSPPGGAFLVGWHEGQAACCGGVKRLDDEVCEIKRARGLYEVEGYAEVEDFNGNPVAVFWGEKPLT